MTAEERVSTYRDKLAEALKRFFDEVPDAFETSEEFTERAVDLVASVPNPELDRLSQENDRLRQHILDIDAHATPYGDIPEDPGYAGTYLVTAGALHRALGKIGHTAPKCEAEAAVERVKQLADDMHDRAVRMLSGEPSDNQIYEASVEDDIARRIHAVLTETNPPPGDTPEPNRSGS